jgi:hypothetical protein
LSTAEQWQPVLAAMEYIVCTKEMSVKAKKKAKVAEVFYQFILFALGCLLHACMCE